MLVYRICKEDEAYNILSTKSLDSIGKYCTINSKLNTHKYESDKRYIHFFKNYDSVFYLNVRSGYYICTYDIPEYLLSENIGAGFYMDRFLFMNKESVTEYAIEDTSMDYDYLRRIDKIIDFIDVEEYMEGDYKGKLQNVFQKSEDGMTNKHVDEKQPPQLKKKLKKQKKI